MTRRLVLGVLAVLMMALTACGTGTTTVSTAEPVAAPTVVSDTKPTAEPAAEPTAESASDADDTTPAEPTAEPSGDGSAPPTATTLDEDYPDAVMVFQQLIVGTLMLEETDYAVTAEQAQELLGLWQMFRAIREGDSPASVEEINATLDMIMAAMTPEQLGAIKAMQLTQDDVRAFALENKISSNPRRMPDSQDLTEEERRVRMLTQGAGPFVDFLIEKLEVWAG